MTIRRVLPLALFISLAAPLFAADDATYAIRLQRPFTAGQTFSVTATNTQRTSQGTDVPASAGAPMSANTPATLFMRRVTLDADVHIDKVDDAGTHASVTLRKLELLASDPAKESYVFSGQSPAAPSTVLPAGTDILLTYGKDDITFTLKNNQPLTPDARSALQLAFQKMPFLDDMYGTPGNKKIGDSWSIDTKSLVMDRTLPQSIDPSQISGTVTLKSARKLFGADCIVLECAQTIKDVPVAGPVPKEAVSKTTFTLTLPVAADKPLIAYSVKVATHIVVPTEAPGGAPRLTNADSEVTHETTWTPR